MSRVGHSSAAQAGGDSPATAASRAITAHATRRKFDGKRIMFLPDACFLFLWVGPWRLYQDLVNDFSCSGPVAAWPFCQPLPRLPALRIDAGAGLIDAGAGQGVRLMHSLHTARPRE